MSTTDLPAVGPELDAAIAVEVMGWNNRPDPVFTTGEYWYRRNGSSWERIGLVCVFAPSTDATTFFADVVPEMRRRGFCLQIHLGYAPTEKYEVIWSHDSHVNVKQRSHENIASAGCLAALAAVRAESEVSP